MRSSTLWRAKYSSTLSSKISVIRDRPNVLLDRMSVRPGDPLSWRSSGVVICCSTSSAARPGTCVVTTTTTPPSSGYASSTSVFHEYQP